MEKSKEVQNASQFPKHYYARHMQPGICGYGTEKVLVDTDAIKRMLGNDAVGKPVYVLHQKVELDTIKDKADGYIIDSFYNEVDGWGWFKILVIDDKAHAAIAKGWSVSNAYVPDEWGMGGTKNNVPYDREIVNGHFTHLAIVPDPRYEDACIMTPDQFKIYQNSKKQQLEELRNSKSQSSGGKTMKLFKFKREEVSTVDADTSIELENGKSITIAEMVNAVKKNADEMDEKMNGDSMVECDGEKMPLKELVNRYNNAMKKNSEEAEEKKNREKKNAEDEAEKKKAKDEEDGEKGDREKKNAEEKAKKEKEDKEEEEKKNAHFLELKNANERGAPATTVVVETGMDKLARGRAVYGSNA
jgi:hypothetical protein